MKSTAVKARVKLRKTFFQSKNVFRVGGLQLALVVFIDVGDLAGLDSFQEA